MGFCRQEYWSGLPFLSPEDLSNSGIELRSLRLQADSLPSELQGSHGCGTKSPCHVAKKKKKKRKEGEGGAGGGMRALIWESGFTKPCCWELVKGAWTG